MASRGIFNSSHRTVSSPHNYDLYHGMDEPLQGDRVFDLLGSYVDGGLMLSPITWTKPRYQWCEGTSVAGSPYPSRHLIVEPLYVRDSSPASGHQRSKEAQDFLYVTDRRGSIRRIPATAFRRGNFARADGTQETTGSNTHRHTCKGGVDSKWHFTVDMKDCSDVQVSTDGDKLTVEGNGFNSDCNYQKSVRYETILPSYVRQDMLTAKLCKGRLTVVQRLVAEDIADPIEVQEQRESVAEKKVQQNESTTGITSRSAKTTAAATEVAAQNNTNSRSNSDNIVSN